MTNNNLVSQIIFCYLILILNHVAHWWEEIKNKNKENWITKKSMIHLNTLPYYYKIVNMVPNICSNFILSREKHKRKKDNNKNWECLVNKTATCFDMTNVVSNAYIEIFSLHHVTCFCVKKLLYNFFWCKLICIHIGLYRGESERRD